MDAYLEKLLRQRLANDHMVDQQLEFFIQNDAFNRLVFPAMEFDGNGYRYFSDNEADLSEKTSYYLRRDAPHLRPRNTCQPVKFGRYIMCAPAAEGGDSAEYFDGYWCKRAIGVEYHTRRTSNPSTLITMYDGSDTVVGMTNSSNIFLVNNGRKQFTGGDKDDTFILNATTFTGQHAGGGGTNLFQLSDEMSPQSVVNVDLNMGTLLMNAQGVSVQDFQVFGGRKNLQEIITAGCSTLGIFGNGGGDRITIPTIPACNHSINVDLVRGTSVFSFTEVGTFIYSVANESGQIPNSVDIKNFHEEGLHSIRLLFGFDEYTDMVLMNDQLEIKSTGGNLRVNNFSELGPDHSYHAQPFISSNDNLTSVVISSNGEVHIIYNHSISTTGGIMAKPFGYWTFYLNASAEGVSGWNNNDTFVVGRNAFRGSINGGLGSNDHLILEQDYFQGSTLNIDMNTGKISNQGISLISFYNIESLTGRPGSQDLIKAGCLARWINSRYAPTKALSNIVDIGYDELCSFQIAIRLEENSKLNNNADNGTFMYILPLQPNIELNLVFSENATHIVYFEFGARDIHTSSISSDNETLFIFDSRKVQISIPVHLPPLNESFPDEVRYFESPHIFTNESGLVRVSPEQNIYFNISEKTDEIIGSPFMQNIFTIHKPLGYGQGGDAKDVYFLIGEDFSGHLNGMGDSNLLVLDQNYTSGIPSHDDMVLIDFTKRGNSPIIFENIQEFLGRSRKTEAIFAHCDTTFIDGMQGFGDSSMDVITFSADDCTYKTTIMVHNFTVIDNYGLKGDFVYSITKIWGF
ncbi:hypothetical protein Fcan01_22790 [Folsomia candida]|uniref:Uncharacterized protein n=1 Tax=Folsomia candida TaxID=158441 RepID=A0A226D9Z4_FOLCA|nr:hypothetical protein Fcan01_22790 [Folsomia candida]